MKIQRQGLTTSRAFISVEPNKHHQDVLDQFAPFAVGAALDRGDYLLHYFSETAHDDRETANGAIYHAFRIPPRREFAAVLGSQSSKPRGLLSG
jgi:hypothetical protein